MKHIILLVTWFAAGQPPNSYRVEFATLGACEIARAMLFREADRLKAEFAARNAASVPPSVSAICAPGATD
jgi:hypothetical protein